jgi:hypothetical protein
MAAAGPVKQRDRGFGAGEDFLSGLDRQRAGAAGQQLTPVPGLASATAAGLARRITPAQWQAVESGLAVVTGRSCSGLACSPACESRTAGQAPAAPGLAFNLVPVLLPVSNCIRRELAIACCGASPMARNMLHAGAGELV